MRCAWRIPPRCTSASATCMPGTGPTPPRPGSSNKRRRGGAPDCGTYISPNCTPKAVTGAANSRTSTLPPLSRWSPHRADTLNGSAASYIRNSVIPSRALRHGAPLSLRASMTARSTRISGSLCCNCSVGTQHVRSFFDPMTRTALYDELGFGYSADGKELEAAAAWRNSLGVRYDAPIALKLALAERRLGHTDEAETTARAIPYAELTVAQRIMRAELIAEMLEGKRQFSGARAALMEADELQPTAEHAHRLGLLAQRAGNDSQAVDDYEKAVAREPDNLLYAESLADAYRRAGRTKQAEKLLQRIVARNPDRAAAYRELAYTQLSLGRQNDAATTLRQGIDAQLATTPPSEGERASEALPAMRAEYQTLARRFATTVYESYRPNGGPAVGGTLNGGVIPSAGGAELSYFPAGP